MLYGSQVLAPRTSQELQCALIVQRCATPTMQQLRAAAAVAAGIGATQCATCCFLFFPSSPSPIPLFLSLRLFRLSHLLRGSCSCSPHFSTVSRRPHVRPVVDSDPPTIPPPCHVYVNTWLSSCSEFVSSSCSLGLHLALVPLLGLSRRSRASLGLTLSLLLSSLLLNSRLSHLSLSALPEHSLLFLAPPALPALSSAPLALLSFLLLAHPASPSTWPNFSSCVLGSLSTASRPGGLPSVISHGPASSCSSNSFSFSSTSPSSDCPSQHSCLFLPSFPGFDVAWMCAPTAPIVRRHAAPLVLLIGLTMFFLVMPVHMLLLRSALVLQSSHLPLELDLSTFVFTPDFFLLNFVIICLLLFFTLNILTLC